MRKIALYVPSMGGGGAEKAILLLANYYVSIGIKVDLILTKAHGPYLAQLDENVNVIDFESRRVIHDFFKIVRYARRYRPDVIVSALSHCNVVLALASKLFPGLLKVVVTEHSNLSASLRENKSIKSRIVKIMMALLYKNVDGVVAVSEGVKQDILWQLGLPESAVRVIYNPFDMDKVKGLSRLSVSHEWLNANRSFKTILSVGRLTRAKDFETLLNAFLILSEKQDVRLLILGEGELRESLQNKIDHMGLGGVVSLFGFVSNPFSYLSKADLFVLSSQREGLPSVLIESLICGVKVVSTDCPSGPREILENGKWGRLVPVGAYEMLAEAMSSALMEKDGGDFSVRVLDFSQEVIGQTYLRYMQEV